MDRWTQRNAERSSSIESIVWKTPASANHFTRRSWLQLRALPTFLSEPNLKSFHHSICAWGAPFGCCLLTCGALISHSALVRSDNETINKFLIATRFIRFCEAPLLHRDLQKHFVFMSELRGDKFLAGSAIKAMWKFSFRPIPHQGWLKGLSTKRN